MLSGPGGRRGRVRVRGAARRPAQQDRGAAEPSLERSGLSDTLLDGAGPPLRALAAEIEDRLGRSPDSGGLLVLLACVPEGLAARVLAALSIDPEALARAAEEARTGDARSALLTPSSLFGECEQLRSEREAALEAPRPTARRSCTKRGWALLEEARATAERRQEELLARAARPAGPTRSVATPLVEPACWAFSVAV